MGDLDRIEVFLRWAWDSSSTRTEPSALGTALINDRFPSYWDGNLLRVERPSDATAAALIAETDRFFSGFAHRSIAVFDAEAGMRLAPAFRDERWEIDRLVFMVRRRQPDRASPMSVEEASIEEVTPFLVETNLHSHGGMTPAAAEANAAVRGMLVETTGLRFFVARVDGSLAGVSELIVHDGVAEIERQHARAVPRPRRCESRRREGGPRGHRGRRRPRLPDRR